MALFGGQRNTRPDWGRALTFAVQGTNGLDRRDAMALAQQQRMQEQQALQQRTMQEDRLRAALSPADSEAGSGMGVAPSIQQQMAALDEARLLNPEVADKFAPVVEARQREQNAATLFANDPKAQMLYRTGNQEFLNSLGEQYKPQVIGAGGRQSVYGEGRTVDAPNFTTVNDTIFRTDPGTGGATPVATAPAAYSDITARMTAERPQLATLSPGQQVYGVGPQGQTTQLAESTAPKPPSAQTIELQSQIDTNANEVIPTLNQMRAALQSGDVITGFGAEAKLGAARLAAAAGNRDAQRVVAATEAYRNMSGRLRVGMAKTLGTNPSNADIKLLEQVTGGDIGQSQQSLISTIDQGLAFANQRAASLTSQLGQAGGGQSQQGGASSARPIAVNPQTGQRVQWNGSAWVPL